MSGIIIEHHIDDKKREDLKVVTWPLWAMEPTTYTKNMRCRNRYMWKMAFAI
jgi:hypothetical protein